MANEGFSGKSFQTAAYRRRGQPLSFRVQHAVFDDDSGELIEYDVVLRIDPALDVIRFGAAMGSFTDAMSKAAAGEGDSIALLDHEYPKVLDAFRSFLVPPDREMFDTVRDGIDPGMGAELLKWISGELTGADPTSLPSSSAG